MNTHTKKLRLRTAAAAVAATVAALLPVFPGTANAAYPKINPGDPVHIYNRDGSISECSIGPYVSMGNGRYGALTAGHCGEDGDPVYWVPPRGGSRAIGELYKPVARFASDGTSLDYGLIPVDSSYVSPDITLNGARVINIATIDELAGVENKSDVTVCSTGVTSGYRCGPLRRVNDLRKWIVADFGSTHGDSGGPVWVPTSQGAVMVGILYGGEDSTGYSLATPIELPIDAYEVKLTVDRY